ncbi:MAG: hypothetical protein K0U98_27760 [Deltaproteobacteria bacterium]|nr:hypothetical protein [Deltaproteobacteria bacterium]
MLPKTRGFQNLLVVALAMVVACAEAPAPVAVEEPKAPVETQAAVDRAVATTGDIITYTVTVDYDASLEVDIPEPGAEIAGFRITDLGKEDTREAEGRIVEERWYKLRADLVGSYVLPPVAVSYSPIVAAAPLEEQQAAETEAAETEAEEEVTMRPRTVETVETSAIFVEVESVLPEDGVESADIRDVKPLRQVKDQQPWGWIGAGILALSAAIALFLWWRRRPAKVVPPVPAHELAFRALDELRDTNFEDAEAVRRFYFQISEVVRNYVEGRFGLNATDLTTEEILPALELLPQLSQQPAEDLRSFLLHTDQVKFADQTPTEEDIKNTYESALGFVEATRPTESELEMAAEDSSGTTESEPPTKDDNSSREQAA